MRHQLLNNIRIDNCIGRVVLEAKQLPFLVRRRGTNCRVRHVYDTKVLSLVDQPARDDWRSRNLMLGRSVIIRGTVFRDKKGKIVLRVIEGWPCPMRPHETEEDQAGEKDESARHTEIGRASCRESAE